MLRPDLRFEAVTRAERMRTVAAMDTAINAVGGWVEDSNFFSNISIAIRCEIPMRNLAEFEETLRKIGLKFDAAARQADADRQAIADVLTVAINVTFIHSEPDLRRTIPSVPG